MRLSLPRKERIDCILQGYHVQPGFIWRQEHLVAAPLKGSRDAIENDGLKVERAQRMQLPFGDVVLLFPLVVSEDLDKGPPQLDDQNCFAQGTSH